MAEGDFNKTVIYWRLKRGLRKLPLRCLKNLGIFVGSARSEYQRLAEMQEEIIWLCEVAHVPVIWATQVVENLVKKGIPSRAEITEVAESKAELAEAETQRVVTVEAADSS